MSLTDTKTKPAVHVRDSFGKNFHEIQNMIRECAYYKFLNRGFMDGDSLTDWLQAQSELLSDVDLELKDDKKKIVVEGDVKGYKPEEIEIEVCDGELRVSGSHKETSTSKEDGKTESRSQARCFYRSFPLPASVNEDKIQVKSTKTGKLKLTLPKKSLPPAKKAKPAAKKKAVDA